MWESRSETGAAPSDCKVRVWPRIPESWRRSHICDVEAEPQCSKGGSLTQTVVSTTLSSLHRGVSLDLIFQAPLQPTRPHGDVLANE